ncbi:MAG: DUF4468 domain-containing protein [Bacteroidales bacterium]|jgi:hypothetical protein|nr:DUF4468 domain-containing protein [Bacteroidales bacterium]
MKKLIILILLLSPVFLFAQNKDTIFMKEGRVIPCTINKIDSNIMYCTRYYNDKAFDGTINMIDVEKYTLSPVSKIEPNIQYNAVIQKKEQENNIKTYSGPKKLIYTEVVKVDSSLKKDDLFISGRAWFNNTFNSSKNVLQTQDKESGEFVGKGTFSYISAIKLMRVCTSGYIKFTINLWVKDGRYKYEFTDFVHEGTYAQGHDPVNFGLITDATYIDIDCWDCWGNKWENEVWNDIKYSINSKVKSLINDLKSSMSKKNEINNDW